MPRLTVPELAALTGREYIGEVKLALRDDTAWLDFLDPALAERTRWALQSMVQSIDRQIERIDTDADPDWLRKINALRRFTTARLARMVPIEPTVVPGSREARAWRAFAARVTRALAENDQSALDAVKTPYGGLTARQWLSARDEKGTDA